MESIRDLSIHIINIVINKSDNLRWNILEFQCLLILAHL